METMIEQFTRLTQQRRMMDVDLCEARRSLARIEGSVQQLSATAIDRDDEKVALLLAEVDCQRRILDALCRLDEEKARLLEKHRTSHEHATRLLKQQLLGCCCSSSSLLSSTSTTTTSNIASNKLFGAPVVAAVVGESLQALLEELRQTEQRIRDLEDALLFEAAESFARQEAANANRLELEEEEKLLRTAIRDTEESIATLDHKLRVLTARDADLVLMMRGTSVAPLSTTTATAASTTNHNHNNHQHSHHHSHGLSYHQQQQNATNIAIKKGALRSQIAQRTAIVKRLSCAAENISPSPSPSSSNYPGKNAAANLSSAAVLLSKFRANSAGPFPSSSPQHANEEEDDEEDFLATSLRNHSDSHRMLSLVKAAACDLREDYDEISSLISRFLVDKSVVATLDARQQQQQSAAKKNTKQQKQRQQQQQQQEQILSWTQTELRRVLGEITRLSTNVLEEQMEDPASGVSVHELLRQIRKFVVLYDILETALGKRSLFEQLHIADQLFGILPQLYPITLAALEVREELKRQAAAATTATLHQANTMMMITSSNVVPATTTASSLLLLSGVGNSSNNSASTNHPSSNNNNSQQHDYQRGVRQHIIRRF